MKNHQFSNQTGLSSQILIEDISHDNPYDFTQIHRHSYFEIFLFKKGDGGSQVIDFVDYSIQSKHLYIVAPNQVHLMQRKPSEDGLVIQFSKSFLQSSIAPFQLDWLYKLRNTPVTSLSDKEFSILYQAFSILKQLQYSNNGYKRQQVRHAFAYIIFQILELLPFHITTEKDDNIAYSFIDLAEKNFKEQRKINLYAQQLGTSVNALNKKIKARFGKTALEIIHEMLIIEIKRILKIEQLSNKEISFQLNFDSQSSYSRFVRKHTGYAPSDLRKIFE